MRDKAPDKTLLSHDTTEAKALANPSDWESRLAEARERRRKVLSEKKAANSIKPIKKSADPVVLEPAEPTESDWEKQLYEAREKRLGMKAKQRAANVESEPNSQHPAAPEQSKQLDVEPPKVKTEREPSTAAANADVSRDQSIPWPETFDVPLGAHVVPVLTNQSTLVSPSSSETTGLPPLQEEQQRKKRVGALPFLAIGGVLAIGIGTAFFWTQSSKGIEESVPVVTEAPIIDERAPQTIAAPEQTTQSDDQTSLAVAVQSDINAADTIASLVSPLGVQKTAPSLSLPIQDWTLPAFPAPISVVNASDIPTLGGTTLAALDPGVNALPVQSGLRIDVFAIGSDFKGNFLIETTPAIGIAPTVLLKRGNTKSLTAPAIPPVNAPLQRKALPYVAASATLDQNAEISLVALSPESPALLRPKPVEGPATQMPAPSVLFGKIDRSLPEIGPAPVPLAKAPSNFVDALGLTPTQAAAFGLYLFSPDSLSETVIGDFETQLDATGLALRKTQQVGFKISKTHIRYYTDGDARLSQELANELGIIARDFTAQGGPDGRIEIWMKGDAGADVATVRESSRASTTRPVTPKPADTRTRLTNSIIQGLRSK